MPRREPTRLSDVVMSNILAASASISQSRSFQCGRSRRSHSGVRCALNSAYSCMVSSRGLPRGSRRRSNLRSACEAVVRGVGGSLGAGRRLYPAIRRGRDHNVGCECCCVFARGAAADCVDISFVEFDGA